MDQHHITRNMAAKGFQIFDIATSRKLSSAVAQFKYKGFIISFCMNSRHILIKSDTCSMAKDDLEFSTVEDAIAAVDAYHITQFNLDC